MTIRLLQKGCRLVWRRNYDYGDCLNSLLPTRVDITKIDSNLHEVFTYSTEKIGLSASDSKRWICDDGISAYAFGHWKTTVT